MLLLLNVAICGDHKGASRGLEALGGEGDPWWPLSRLRQWWKPQPPPFPSTAPPGPELENRTSSGQAPVVALLGGLGLWVPRSHHVGGANIWIYTQHRQFWPQQSQWESPWKDLDVVPHVESWLQVEHDLVRDSYKTISLKSTNNLEIIWTRWTIYTRIYSTYFMT